MSLKYECQTETILKERIWKNINERRYLKQRFRQTAFEKTLLKEHFRKLGSYIKWTLTQFCIRKRTKSGCGWEDNLQQIQKLFLNFM